MDFERVLLMRKIFIISLLMAIITLHPIDLFAGDEEQKNYNPTISGQWFIAYQYGMAGGLRINIFLGPI